jgi:Nucleotidyltransferase
MTIARLVSLAADGPWADKLPQSLLQAHRGPAPFYRQMDIFTRLSSQLEASLRDNPVVSALLARWTKPGLPDCWIVAGAIVQSYWNKTHGYSPLQGIGDADIKHLSDICGRNRHSAR